MSKKSPIMQMFYGERGFRENINCSDEYKRLLNKVSKYEEEFRNKLNDFPELQALYEKLDSSKDDVNIKSVDEYYLEGFRFGFLMAMDVMKND